MSKANKLKPEINVDSESAFFVSHSKKKKTRSLLQISTDVTRLSENDEKEAYQSSYQPNAKSLSYSRKYSSHKHYNLSKSQSDLMKQAWKLFSQGDFQQSIPLYDEILAQLPDYKPAKKNKIIALDKLAASYMKEKKFSKAKNYLEQAAEIDSNNAHVIMHFGDYWQYSEPPNFEQAHIYYQKAFKLAQTAKLPIISKLERCLEILPRHAIKYYMARHDIETASNYIKKVEQYAGEDEVSWNRMARLYFQLGNIPEQIKCYDKAYKIIEKKHAEKAYSDEEYVFRVFQYAKNKTFSYISCADFINALKYNVASFELDDQDVNCWKSLAIILYNMGFNQEALICIGVSLSLDYNYAEAFYHEAVILKEMHYLELAIDSCQCAKEMTDETIRGHFKISSFLGELKTLATGEFSPLHNTAVRASSYKSGALAKKAKSLCIVKAYDLAIKYYHKAIEELDKPSRKPFILEEMATCFLFQGEYNKAKTLLEEAKEVATVNLGSILDHMGSVLILQKLYSEAESYLSAALELRTKSKTYFKLAITNLLQHKFSLAKEGFSLAYLHSREESFKLENDKDLEKKTQDILDKAMNILPKSYKPIPDIKKESVQKLYQEFTKSFLSDKLIKEEIFAEFFVELIPFLEEIHLRFEEEKVESKIAEYIAITQGVDLQDSSVILGQNDELKDELIGLETP